jgi:RimJ/RimL family protein N-acetyltransferase
VWLKVPAVGESFVPRFPENESELRKYFTHPTREYFGIYYNDQLVGIVGGENIDEAAGKLEMKKLVGESGLQGKGIGKRATFGFLYYAFVILNLNKVYIHSRDINMRNINLWFRAGRSFPRRHQRRRQIPGHCAHGFVQTTLAAIFFARRLTER